MADRLGEEEALRDLLGSAHAVLFDFDGPVTDLFRGVSTAPVARRIKEAVRAQWGSLDPDLEACDDSHGILRLLRDMYDRPAPTPRAHAALEQAEDIVTQQEYEAVASARPAPYVKQLVRALSRVEMRLVVVSNNAEGPVWEFLKTHALEEFEAVVGRDPHELRHMKPDPYSVNRAVKHLGLPPARCLLIGDQLTDLKAAQAAGTRFLGHTRSEERAADMRRHGADHVVASHRALLGAVKHLRKSN